MHLPLVLPPVVVGYLLLIGFGVRGPIGHWLYENFGIRLAFTSEGASLATAVMAFPLMVRAIRLALDAVDRGLEDAARTLGAGAIDRFVSITLPLMLPGFWRARSWRLRRALASSARSSRLRPNIPGETQTLPLAIYQAIQTPDGDAMAARLALLSIVLALGGLILSEMLARRVKAMTGAP